MQAFKAFTLVFDVHFEVTYFVSGAKVQNGPDDEVGALSAVNHKGLYQG